MLILGQKTRRPSGGSRRRAEIVFPPENRHFLKLLAFPQMDFGNLDWQLDARANLQNGQIKMDKHRGKSVIFPQTQFHLDVFQTLIYAAFKEFRGFREWQRKTRAVQSNFSGKKMSFWKFCKSMESVIFHVHTSISKFIHFNLAVCNSRGGAPSQERSALYPLALNCKK